MVLGAIYIIAGLALRGAAIGMMSSLENDVKDSRRRWKEKRQQLELTIEEHEEKINEHIEELNSISNFHELTDLHFSSFRVANNAYSLKNDAQTTLRSLLGAINKIKEEINELIELKKEKTSIEEKEKVEQQIIDTVILNNKLVRDFNEIDKELEGYSNKVRNFNRITRNLKFAIRDDCGERGEEWYNRLEERKREKRESE